MCKILTKEGAYFIKGASTGASVLRCLMCGGRGERNKEYNIPAGSTGETQYPKYKEKGKEVAMQISNK